jgi:hypothetical protein
MQNAEQPDSPQAPFPVQTVVEEGVWRDGPLLVVRKGASLPDRCVVCDAPANGGRRSMTFYWSPKWLAYRHLVKGWQSEALKSVLWLLIFVETLFTHRSANVQVGICRRCRLVRQIWLTIFAMIFLLGLALVIREFTSFGSQFFLDHPTLAADSAIFGMLSLIVGACGFLYLLTAGRLLKPERIDDHYGWYRGASPAYLARLPESPMKAVDS